MHYIRLVVLGDSQVGKTSLIKQLVGEELKSGPELKCEAQIEAIQTRIEKTWLSELNDHEDKLEQALATKRLASLLASQIELQQLLLKQQQQRGNRLPDKATNAHSSGCLDQATSSTNQKPGSKCASNTLNRDERSQAGTPNVASNLRENESTTREPAIRTEQHNNVVPNSDKENKCRQHSETVVRSSQGPESNWNAERRNSEATSAPNSSSLLSHQNQLTYHEAHQLERPTILISSSSVASSSTNLFEQSEPTPPPPLPSNQQSDNSGESEEPGAQAEPQVLTASGRKQKELIEITCTPSRDPSGNQQFNDGRDRNQCGQQAAEPGRAQFSIGNKFPSSINQPLKLDHNRDDFTSPCVSTSVSYQQQPTKTKGGESTVANKTSAGNANHVPDGKQKGQQTKRLSDSEKGNIREEETTRADVGARGECAIELAKALKAGGGQHGETNLGQQTILVQSQHEQLKQMRSLDVFGRKLTATASAMSGSGKDSSDRKDDVALRGASAKNFPTSPSHLHQHRHSYCAPTTLVEQAANGTTTSGTSSRFAATKDELSTQAKIINILFSNNKNAMSASPNNQEPKSSTAQEATTSGSSNKPLLMPALLRQYQRRLSNFHSHISNHQQQQQQPEQSPTSGQKQNSLTGGTAIDRKSSIVQVMSELILAEQRRRAQLVKGAAMAAATLATSAAAAAQALLVARSPMINTSQFKTLMDDHQRARSQWDSPNSQGAGGTSAQELDDERAIALERLPLPIFGGCQPSSWIRGSETLDEHGICHEANLYALTEEYRLKLASYGTQPQSAGSELVPIQRTGGVQQNNDLSEQASRQPIQLTATVPSASLSGNNRKSYQNPTGHKYNIKHFCANYIDNMNLYEIKIVDMPTIEPISEFPTSSLLEWSLFKGRSHLLTADAYLLVFDLTRPSTIQYIKMLRDKIFESREMSNVPVYVIANKADLCPTLQPSLQARQMRNVAVHRHQASLSSGNEMSAGAGGSGAAAETSGQSARADQRPKPGANKLGVQTKPKWHLLGTRSASEKISTASAPMPPPPTTFNLASEQRSVPAAAAHQLLTAYKMHRMRLGGTGPIVSLRRWAKLRHAVNEPHSYGGYSGAASYTGSSSAWSQFERKRMHYSLIIGASSGFDSRGAVGPGAAGTGRLGVALGRVRSCIRSSWCRLKGKKRKSRHDIQAENSRGKRRYRSRFSTTRFQQPSSRRKRRRSRATRIRDRTESALIKGAKRRKSSIFAGAFSWNQGHSLDGAAIQKSSSSSKKRRTGKKSARKTSKSAKGAGRGKNISAATRRSNWSNWLHLSAPSELTPNVGEPRPESDPPGQIVAEGGQPKSRVGGLVAATWRASGERLGLKRKRASCSDASVGSAGSTCRGILKLSKRDQQHEAPTHSTCHLGVDEPTRLESVSTIHQRDSNTETTTGDVDLTLRQSDVTIDPAALMPKRRFVEPVCGAMSTPASRQTFYDLFNRLLQTSSTTAAKTQLKLGAIQAADGQQQNRKNSGNQGSSALGANGNANQGAIEDGGQLLKISLNEQQSDRKSKRRKSSSTGAALWQTLSSIALSRISQSGDRKGSGQKLETGGESGVTQRSATVLGGRLSVTSRASGCSLSGSTILEDPQQQQGKQRDSVDKETNRREAQTNLFSSDGLRLGTDQYLSVDMLRKLSLISSHSQISGGEETGLEVDDGNPKEDGDDLKRPKSAPSEPVGVAQALRRASRVWLGGKTEKHKKQHEIEDTDGENENSLRPHTSEPGTSAGGAGAKRFWYRGVVKKILFHSNKQSLKGIVTAIELQRKADEEARAAEEGEHADGEPGGSSDAQQSENAVQGLVIDVTVQPEPSSSKTIEEQVEEEEEDEDNTRLADSQQPRRQSLAVVQSAPAIRIISSGSSLSLLSENNASGSSDPSKQTAATPTKTSNETDASKESSVGEQLTNDNKKTLNENVKDQDSPGSSMAKQTISASSSAGSLASSSASLSESVTLNIDGNARAKLALGEDRAETAAGSADLNADEQAVTPNAEKSDSSDNNSNDSDDEDEEDSSPLAGLDEPQLSYQLRKLSADDCLIINRHRRQSLAALKDDQALSVLKNRSDQSDKTKNLDALDRVAINNSTMPSTTSDEAPPERAATGEEGRRQSIKQSIEAAIHLLVPRAKARSASITLGATNCEQRSRSQLGTAIMGAVNVHKTWRDWRQLLGRKKSAASNKESGGLRNLCDKVISNGIAQGGSGRPNLAFSGGHLLSDSFNTQGGVAPPPIVGFLSSHVAYKKLSVDQQREAAINFDQLMRINQLTLTAANVVMLAASQPPIRQPLSSHQTDGKHASRASKKHPARHHHHHKSGLSESSRGALIGAAADIRDGLQEEGSNPNELVKSVVNSLGQAEQTTETKKRGTSKGGKGKHYHHHHQQENSSGSSATGFQPLMTRIQSGGNLLLRKSSLSGDKTSRAKRKAAAKALHDESKQQCATASDGGAQQQDDLFGSLALLGSDICMDPSQAADLLRVQSVLGDESSSAATAAAAAAAAAAASSQAPPAEGDISAQIAAAAASALERQRRRGEKLSAILEPRYDKKQPGAEYPSFGSHDLNPILKDLAQLVRKHWKCNYIECSAASNWNIRPIISELTRALECNNRLSTSSSGISVGDDYSERGNRVQYGGGGGPSRSDRVFDDEDDDENDQSDDVWSSDGDDYRLDDEDDSALSSRGDESSFDFISSSSDESDPAEADSGMNADDIRTVQVGKTKRSAVRRSRGSRGCERSSSSAQATKCSIM